VPQYVLYAENQKGCEFTIEGGFFTDLTTGEVLVQGEYHGS
jgi:hypothetical protein